MKTKIYSLFFSMLLCFTVIETKANAIRIAHCKLSDGTVRVFVEHDQGDLSNSSLSNYGLTFITNYGFGSNTVNKTPSGFMNNKGVNALSSCGSSISVTACTNSNTYEDWVYFDFTPGSCNNSLSITVHLNVNTVLAENCSSLFPTTFTIGYPDNTSPVITCKADITVANITDRCDSTLKIISPSVTDNCSQLILGNSLNFDGVNDFALVQATSEINTREQSQRTVEVYFRVNDKSISSRKQVIWEEGGEANGLNIYVFNGLLYYGIYSESKSWNGVWISTDKIKSGQWHNAVLVYDGTISSKRLSAYLDGELVGSKDASSDLGSILDDHPRANAVGALYQNGKFHTGDDFSTQAHFFGGDIDEIRLWKIARTDSALKSTNTVKLKGNETGLVVYYDFDQGIACGKNLNEDTLYDRTATKLHADLSSFILDSACKSNWTNGSPALNSPLTLTNSYTGTSDASGTYPVGTTDVVWTATDESNNSTSCTQKITVLDKQAPTILCSGSKNFENTSGLCGYTVPNTNLDPIAFGDNCSGSTIFNNLNNQSSLYNELIPTGTNIVIWTVKDASNNTTTCSDTIKVTDKEAPVISGIVNLTLGNIENRCDTTLKMVSPEVTDNCSKLIFGNALNFDGSNDIALVNSSSSLNQTENSQRTVEVYFRVNDKNIRSRKQIIWEEGGLVNGLNIYVFDGKLYYGIYSETNNWNGTWLSTSAVNSGQWHNAVLVYDGTQTTGRLKAYLDGNLIGSANASSSLGTELAVHMGANAVGAMQQNGKFHSGDESTSLGHYFGGDIDEIRLWTVARTETELQSTNTKKLVGNETGLVVYYDFDQGTACGNNIQEDTLYDRTATGLDAPLPGFALNNGCTSNWTNGSPALNSPLRLTNSFTGTSDASGTYPVGTTTITWTATDEYNNTSSSTQTVTVLDKQSPTITCISNQERAMDQGVCTYTVKGNEFDPTAYTDNCSGYVLTNSFNDSSTLSGEVFQNGTNTIVWTITDASNNSTQCSFDITIIDSETPVFTCNSDITLFTDSGSCSVDLTIDRPVFSENCNAVVSFTIDEDSKYRDSIINRLPAQDKKSYSSTQAARSAKKKSSTSAGFKKTQKLNYSFELGETVITWIVIDNQGNADTCIQKVTLIDTIYPKITVPADIHANADSGKCSASGITIGTPTTSDNCDILSISNDAPSTFSVGTTNIIWKVKDTYGNISSDTQLVVVTDNEKPAITCSANQSQTADAGVCKAAVTVTAPSTSDNCGVASVTNDYTNTSDASGTYPVGSTTVTWTVTDIHNNTSICKQVITVTDNEKPGITCAEDQSQTADAGVCKAAVTVTAPSTSDNCGVASVTNDYTNTADASGTYPVGSTTVTWTVTDIHNNTSTCTQVITVTDNEKPAITCSANQSQTADAGVCKAAVTVTAPSTSDNCGVASVTNDYTNTSDASGTYPVGSTTVTWTVTDIHNNTSTCTQVITVTDNEKPAITCAANQSQTADAGVCKAAVTVTAPSTSDNCGVASVTNDYTNTSDASGTYPVGSTTVTWTVTDIHNNTSSCKQVITVTDNEKPAITCSANQSQTADAGVCKAAVTVTAPSTSDNCGVASVTNDYTNTSDASGTYPVGSTTVTWTVTDIHNNTSTCTQVITVTDNEKPKALCSDVNVILSGGIATISETDINNSSSDNCGIANMSLSRYSFNCNDIGNQKVTLSITDLHSNTNACEANVKVIGTIPTLTIVQSNLPSFCQGEFVTLTANSNETVNYIWSNNDTSADTKIYTRGNYTVQVKNIFGCTTSASSYVNFDTTKLVSAYTIIVDEEVELENNSSVQSGGVGALGKKGSIELKDNSSITNAGTFAKAYDIDVKSGSSISAKYEGTPLSLAIPKFAYNPYCDSKCESKHHHKCESSCSKNEHYHCKSNCSSTHKHCSNQKCNKQSNLKIKKGSTVVITDSIFQNIQIETGATVTFKSKNIYADELKTQKNVTIKFDGCTRIYLCKYLEIDEENKFNTENNSVIVYAEKKVGIKEGATVYANIYTLEKLETKGDCRKRNKLTGMFIAEELKSEYTDFNKNSVCGSCGTLGKKEIASNTEGVRQSSEDFISVYPNPTKNSASININANYRGTITMNVLSATGEVISTYINNEFNGLELMEINLSNMAVGMYFIDINYGLTHKVYKIQKQL